ASSSTSSGKGKPCLSRNLRCDSALSVETPRMSAPSSLISSKKSRKLQACLVQPGVSSRRIKVEDERATGVVLEPVIIAVLVGKLERWWCVARLEGDGHLRYSLALVWCSNVEICGSLNARRRFMTSTASGL